MPPTAVWTDDELVLDTGRIERRFRLDGGGLHACSIRDHRRNTTWSLDDQALDVGLPGVEQTGAELTISRRDVAEGASTWAHLEVTVTCRYPTIQIRRLFRLYADCPAIAGEVWLKGTAVLPWRNVGQEAGDKGNIERLKSAFRHELPGPHVERLRLLRRHHLEVEAVRFFDITDLRNNLVQRESILPYREPVHLVGNLLLIRDVLADDGLFLVKEAPCSDVQLAWPGADFVVQRGNIVPVGIGLDPEDLSPDEWRQGYGLVTGVGGLNELREYQHRRRLMRPDRDQMILVNTWGDRGQDSRIREAFALAELDACKRLGATHLQLDDGWQKGQSSNSAFRGGSLDGIWQQPDYWHPHPERFPNGLQPVVDRARELGIELCLWFNPSKDDGYAHWRDDADTLIALHRRHGTRTFKIDGVVMPDHRAHRNFRAFLEAVHAATAGEVVFNLDVTAGRRWGYHLGAEYGNLFLENRYTDWGNYYPHWTLRNLWQLSRYVPPQSLQVEFLNLWRNEHKYAADDPLRPANVPFAYAFAITMMAQPLGWFEAQGLPRDAFAIAPLIRTCRDHLAAVHAGRIFPIGEEPSGTGWSGFQSCDGDHGYLLILREWNQRPRARLKLWEAPTPAMECTLLAGDGESCTVSVDENGAAEFALPNPFSFAFYRY